jgi:toxin ParE1/3/4
MKLKTTRQADADIIDIYVRGAGEFGAAQAERYHEGLLATFQLLLENPRLARLYSAFDPPVRMYPYNAHLIVYRDEDDAVVIVRVLHGRQQWEQHL